MLESIKPYAKLTGVNNLLFIPGQAEHQNLLETDEWLPHGAIGMANSANHHLPNQRTAVVDGSYHDIDLRHLPRDLTNIGLYATICNYPVVVDFLRSVKEVRPDIRVGIGGPYAQALWKKVIERQAFDYLGIGYGEDTWETILANGLSDRVPNVAFIDKPHSQKVMDLERDGIVSGNIVKGPPADYQFDRAPIDYGVLQDLDMRNQGFWKRKPQYYGFRVATLMAAIGCPAGPRGRCSFCTRLEKRYRVRHHTDYALDIQRLTDLYGQVGIVDITDDIVHRHFLENLDQDLDRLGIDRSKFIITGSFGSAGRLAPDNLSERDRENYANYMAGLLRKIGIKSVLIGFESRDEEILRRNKNGLTQKQQDIAFQALIDHGIGVEAAFIIGLQGETPETARATFDYAQELLKRGYQAGAEVTISISPLTLIPGSQLYALANTDPDFRKQVDNTDVLDVEALHKEAARLLFPKLGYNGMLQFLNRYRALSWQTTVSEDFKPLAEEPLSVDSYWQTEQEVAPSSHPDGPSILLPRDNIFTSQVASASLTQT